MLFKEKKNKTQVTVLPKSTSLGKKKYIFGITAF